MYLDALSDLVASYEDQHHPIAPASDADMLRHLMEAKGVTQTQVSREAGIAKSTISEVLAGKKPLSRRMIRSLAGYFKRRCQHSGGQSLSGIARAADVKAASCRFRAARERPVSEMTRQDAASTISPFPSPPPVRV